jgi:hypothetical protein
MAAPDPRRRRFVHEAHPPHGARRREPAPGGEGQAASPVSGRARSRPAAGASQQQHVQWLLGSSGQRSAAATGSRQNTQRAGATAENAGESLMVQIVLGAAHV